MNELLIDGKTYISTKRAAELTKYTKDYVGQLARGQKIPARLVGRNWYVDEQAILIHAGLLSETPQEETANTGDGYDILATGVQHEAAMLEKQDAAVLDEGYSELENVVSHDSKIDDLPEEQTGAIEQETHVSTEVSQQQIYSDTANFEKTTEASVFDQYSENPQTLATSDDVHPVHYEEDAADLFPYRDQIPVDPELSLEHEVINLRRERAIRMQQGNLDTTLAASAKHFEFETEGDVTEQPVQVVSRAVRESSSAAHGLALLLPIRLFLVGIVIVVLGSTALALMLFMYPAVVSYSDEYIRASGENIDGTSASASAAGSQLLEKSIDYKRN